MALPLYSAFPAKFTSAISLDIQVMLPLFLFSGIKQTLKWWSLAGTMDFKHSKFTACFQ